MNKILIILIFPIFFADTSCKKDNREIERKNPVIARVNGEAITRKELEMEKKLMFFTQPKASQEAIKIINKNLLVKIIDKKILLQEARKNYITISREELEKEIARIKSDYPDENFLNFFKENAISYDDWKNKLTELMIVQKLLDSVTAGNPSVSDEEIYLYYKEHIDDFKNINKIVLRQILLQDARTAEEVKRRLKAGENFEELVTELSIGYEKRNGGLLAPLSKDELPKELEGVFKLNTNEIFGPVKTDYGYHILRVEKKLIRKKIELKEAKNTIIEILKSKKNNNSLKEYLTNLRKHAKIEIYSPEILNTSEI